MTCARPRRHRAGFWLLELLFVLGFLGIFALAATKLFTATVRLGHDAAESQNHAATLESVTAAIRSDVWPATKFEVADSNTATLHLPDNHTVTWSIGGNEIARRENDGPVRRWPIPAESTFVADDSTMVLRLHPTRTTVAGEVRFASQVRLIARLGS